MALQFYIHNNQKYITSFPTTLFPLKSGTGPQECKNCEFYGTTHDGVFIGFCENCNHSYDNQFESRTDVSVIGAIESHCLPELVLPNYITDAEFIIIQRIFIDELKNIKKKSPNTATDNNSDVNSDVNSDDNSDVNFIYCECGEKVYINKLDQEDWVDAYYYYNKALCSTCHEKHNIDAMATEYGPETQLKQMLSCIQQPSTEKETKQETEDIHCFCGFKTPMKIGGNPVYARYAKVPICECMRDAYNRPYIPTYIDEEPLWFP